MVSKVEEKQDPKTLEDAGVKTSGNLKISDAFDFEEPVEIGPSCQLRNVQVGAFSYLVGGNFLTSTTVGRFCSIAANAVIGPGQHPTDGLTSSPFIYDPAHFTHFDGYVPHEEWSASKPVTLGHDVWIGRNAVVMDGVTIQNGAIIGTNAVVTRDVASYEIVAGVPAKHIRWRFSEEIVRDLLELRWWEYDIRRWLQENPSVRTIPLDVKIIERLQNAIVCGHLKKLSTRRTLLEIVNGKAIFTRRPS